MIFNPIHVGTTKKTAARDQHNHRILVDDLLEANNPANRAKQQVQPSVTTGTATTTVRGVLPGGWEERFTPEGRPYYIIPGRPPGSTLVVRLSFASPLCFTKSKNPLAGVGLPSDGQGGLVVSWHVDLHACHERGSVCCTRFIVNAEENVDYVDHGTLSCA